MRHDAAWDGGDQRMAGSWLVSIGSRAVLLLVYAFVVTPLGVLCRLAGRDTLQLRRSADRHTYWSRRPMARDDASYRHQL